MTLAPIPFRDPEQRADDALAEWLGNDLRRAYRLMSTHLPGPGGWCTHQGADPRRERWRWPCRLHNAAHHAVIARSPLAPRRSGA